MTFAFALTVVVLFSSILLLYQYWTGALAGDAAIGGIPDDESAPRDFTPVARDDAPRRAQPVHQVDNAA